MEELSWYVGARITRNSGGGIHWFVESSDGLSGGNLVDEATPDTVMVAILSVRQEVFAELLRLYNTATFQYKLPGT
jgi:hypothetical protein